MAAKSSFVKWKKRASKRIFPADGGSGFQGTYDQPLSVIITRTKPWRCKTAGVFFRETFKRPSAYAWKRYSPKGVFHS